MLKPFLLSLLLLSKIAAFGQTQNLHAQDSPEYAAFQAWVMKTINYPESARKKGIQGIVYVQFKIDDAYHVVAESIKVVSGLTTACDNEALRVLKLYRGTFSPPDKSSVNKTVPWIVPFNFVISNGASKYAVSGPDYKFDKAFKAIVASKTLKNVSPNWSMYPNAFMTLPMKSVAPGDTVDVAGWSPGAVYVHTPYAAGFISYKALSPSTRVDSLVKIIEAAPEPVPVSTQKAPRAEINVATYDTALTFTTEHARFTTVVNKSSVMAGECVSISGMFNVDEENKLRIQFHDLPVQVGALQKKLRVTNGIIFSDALTEIAGVEKVNSSGRFTQYEIYRVNVCPATAGNLVVPIQHLQMLVAKDPTKPAVGTVVKFASEAIKLKVEPLPDGVTVSTFHNYTMVGAFKLREGVAEETIKAGQRFDYVVQVEANVPTFPIEPTVFTIPDLTLQLSKIEDERASNGTATTKTFTYSCVATKPGTYDFTDKIVFNYYTPGTGKPGTLRSKTKVTIADAQPVPDRINTGPFYSNSFLIALDISQSMMLEDYPTNRLSAVKEAIKRFSRKHDMCKVGVLYFGGNVKPLDNGGSCFNLAAFDTLSYKHVENGTAIADAIWFGTIAAKKGAPAKLVIIGDGDNTAGFLHPSDAADFAKSKGVKVFSIGVGHTGDVKYGSDFFGRAILISDTFNDNDFKSIASRTGGHYTWANDVNAIVAALDKIFQMP